MGAITTTKFMIGKFANVNDAIADMNEDSRYEHGNDYYSGGIHNCNRFHEEKTFPRFDSKAFDDWAEKKEDNLSKGEGFFIELPKSWVAKNRPGRLKGKRGVKAYYFVAVVPY